MSAIEAPAGRDNLPQRAQAILAAIRSSSGAWIAPREVRELLAAEGNPISGTHLRKYTGRLLERGLIEATGSNADRRYRMPPTDFGGEGWGGGTLVAPALVAKARAKKAEATVNLTVVRRRILHELVYRRHDAEGLALCLGLDLAVVEAVVAGLLEARLICCDGDKYAGMP